MHYYKFNIADWVKDTAHLTLKEEAILLRLFNYYISTETNIPTKTQMVLRKLRLGDESETVEILLEEFFTKEKDGYHIKELDKLISEYQKRAEKNRNNGKSGGRPKNNDLVKPTGFPDANHVESESKPDGNLNHKPLTKNHKPVIKETNADAIHILEELNQISGKSFRTDTKSNQQMVNLILKDGYTVEDCILVCRFKNWQWKDDQNQREYIRPATLFAKKNFDGYLQAAKMELSKRDTAKTIQQQTPEQLAEIKLKREQEEAAQMRRDLGIE